MLWEGKLDARLGAKICMHSVDFNAWFSQVFMIIPSVDIPECFLDGDTVHMG